MSEAETSTVQRPTRQAWHWLLMVTAVLCLILIPFALFGKRIDAWTISFLDRAGEHKTAVALVLGGLLAGDILLPVPSSIVSTACGVLLGLGAGTLVSTVGMVVSCLIGFGLGASFGRPLALRMVGESGLAGAERLSRRWGDWVLIVTRPVPVLAEASVLFLSMGRMSFRRFLLLSALSNLAISLVYAALGAFSSDLNTFLPAFLASMGVPGVALLLFKKETDR